MGKPLHLNHFMWCPSRHCAGSLLFLVMTNDVNKDGSHLSASCFEGDASGLGLGKDTRDVKNVQTILNEMRAGETNMHAIQQI